MSPVRWNLPPDESDEEDGAVDLSRQYEQTLMYGRYKKELGDYAKETGEDLRRKSLAVPLEKDSYLNLYGPRRERSQCGKFWAKVWSCTFAKIGEDWVFLALLGVLMAFISFMVDFVIGKCNITRIWLYWDLSNQNPFLQYLSWVCLPVCLVVFSAGFVHLLAPQAVGSGIPEMKTILRGVVLKEYLTFKTLCAKIIGLSATLGAGLPLGKEGPFVHIASIVATLLSKAVSSFKGIYENDSRTTEMLAAACAVGVACSFAAPIGGVLFSIEVTSVYFAVRNYWRGFFASVCGAMVFRLMSVWFQDEETLTALFRTNFTKDFPFDLMEIIIFALIGAVCGFLGAFFVYVHRRYVNFMRRNKKMKAFLQKSRFLYPFLVALIYSSFSFPLFFGQFVAGSLTTHQQVDDLFSNITWTKTNRTVHEYSVVRHWETPYTNLFVNLLLYICFTFCSTVLASTLPVPSGIFIPVFKMGAALGRLVGELMAIIFPTGLHYVGINHDIIPGGYAIVGAAAFAGSVTHTISTSVIVFELSGQITHIIPVMIAVLIANGIAQIFQPSIYDSIIRIKKLPYLPDILTSKTGAYNIYVENFMVRRVKYIWYGITYRELKEILIENKKIRSLPLVDSPDSMILLGSIQRGDLISLMDCHLGKERRSRIVNKWKMAADKALEAEFEEKSNHKDSYRDSVRSFSSICKSLIHPHSDKDTRHHESLSASRVLRNLFSNGKDKSDDTKATEESKPLNQHEDKPIIAAAPIMETLSVDTTQKECSTRSISFEDLNPKADSPKLPAEKTGLPDIDENRKENHTAGSVPKQEVSDVNPVHDNTRRASRFAVTKVVTPSESATESPIKVQLTPPPIDELDSFASPYNTITRNSLPKRGILKKTHSFIIPPSDSPLPSPNPTPYATVHGDTGGFRDAVGTVNHRRSSSKSDIMTPKLSFSSFKRLYITPQMKLEKTMEQQRLWEEEELDKVVDFTCNIDPAPFQLVERTSLLKVHSLFSMLGLNHAYVTVIGRLIGVVALKELRRAIEEANQGEFLKLGGDKSSTPEEKLPLTNGDTKKY